jgi:UDP-glucose:(heptosyl)LPS alpha-1,3-glucosyltransferase
MRIALVIEQYDPARGGVEQWTCQFARQLDQWGHEVHVIARRFGNVFAHRVIRHYVPDARSRLAFAAAAEQKLRRLAPDIIHDTGAGWHANVFQPHGGSRLAAFQQNLLLLPAWARPLKVRASQLLPRYRQFQQLAARQYANDGRLILALSKMVAHDLQRWHGVSRERIRVIYNGVDTNRFSPGHRQTHRAATREQLGVQADEVLLLIVAHNPALKGVPALLAAVGTLRRQGLPVRLAVVGARHVGRYRRLAKRWGAAGLTTFVGPVGDPVPYYAAADVYVQPTLYDPCSLVVLEALASGLPVVTSRFNGAGELLTEGCQGYVVNDPLDWRRLADCIRPLADADRRKQMSAAARALALQHTMERNCREILDVYHQVASVARRAA